VIFVNFYYFKCYYFSSFLFFGQSREKRDKNNNNNKENKIKKCAIRDKIERNKKKWVQLAKKQNESKN
jgi:hypothetical protein